MQLARIASARSPCRASHQQIHTSLLHATHQARRHRYSPEPPPDPGRFTASSGLRSRHRLNPRGNRKLNHALHLAAVTQVRHDTPGRAYYQRKIAEGKTKNEALRGLKRRISDAVWRQLQLDLGRR